MKTEHSHLLRMVMLAMLVAIGVVISPILRIEGMCRLHILLTLSAPCFLDLGIPFYAQL